MSNSEELFDDEVFEELFDENDNPLLMDDALEAFSKLPEEEQNKILKGVLK